MTRQLAICRWHLVPITIWVTQMKIDAEQDPLYLLSQFIEKVSANGRKHYICNDRPDIKWNNRQ